VDNDGFKDLIASPNAVAGSENFQSVWLYKNASSTPTVNFVFQKKNFLQEDMMEFGEGAYPVLFDANGDGLKDLIVGNLGYYITNTNKASLAYYRNTGTLTSPSFSLITRDYQSLSSYNIFSMAPAFGDLDSDGDVDLLIGDAFGKLHYFENTAGSLNPAVFSNYIPNYHGIDVGTSAFPQLFDVDKDGKLDLVSGSQNGKIEYRKNTGTSTSPVFTLQSSFFGGVDVRQPGWFTGYSMPQFFREGGVTKLLVGRETGNLFLYDNIDGNLTGSFNRIDTALFGVNEGPRCAPYFEDITNDGKRDLFLGNYAGGLAFFNSSNVNDVSVKEYLHYSDVDVYPNPVYQTVFVSIKDHTYSQVKVQCVDMLGNEVFGFSSYNKTLSIDVSGLASGVYFLSLQFINAMDGNVITKKIVVQ
jgi:hypothetical protein